MSQQSNSPTDKSYGIPIQHESVGVANRGSDMSEHNKGKKIRERAVARHHAAIAGKGDK